jgi:glycosyltransferase involved in cell wall biosynthesis
LQEGLGVAALEATAAGLPVIASAIGGLPEIVDHQRTGILVEPGDPTAFARALIELAIDGQRRTAMGKDGRRRAVENWSTEMMALRTLALYEACLAALPLRTAVEPASSSG